MHKAFTLIELLVVVLIIGILSAIALPQYQKSVARARVTEAFVAMKALTDAEEIYYMANGSYTNELSNLDLSMPQTSNYYTFLCLKDNYPSCLAIPSKEGYPVMEFVLQHIGSTAAGKHWCQSWDVTMSEAGKAKALEICKTFGSKDTTVTHSDYYLMQ